MLWCFSAVAINPPDLFINRSQELPISPGLCSPEEGGQALLLLLHSRGRWFFPGDRAVCFALTLGTWPRDEAFTLAPLELGLNPAPDGVGFCEGSWKLDNTEGEVCWAVMLVDTRLLHVQCLLAVFTVSLEYYPYRVNSGNSAHFY